MPETAIALGDGTPRYSEGLPEEWNWGWLQKFGKLAKFLSGKIRRIYRYMTAWPSEALLAQTWDIPLWEEIGRAIGTEMLEAGISVWLAPGLSIHRKPHCAHIPLRLLCTALISSTHARTRMGEALCAPLPF